jgi:FtsZ-interacting cell division protein ZipA
MNNETGQLDIADRLMIATDAQAKPSEWTEIGQAEIIHTIFGKAKVRVIRKNQKIRRIFIILATVALLALVWEGWILFKQYETAKRNESLFRININTNEHRDNSVSSHGNISTSESSGIMKRDEENHSGSVINNTNVTTKDKLEQPQNILNSGKIVTRQPVSSALKAVRPQSASLAANRMEPTNQADKTAPPFQSPKPLPQQNNVPLREVQVPSGSPATATPLQTPLSKEDAATAPAGENQLVEPTSPKQ